MSKRISLYSLLFTLFNDAMGWGIVLTIFAPLLFDVGNGILPEGTSQAARNMIIGLLISSYGATQFFSMPVIGALSDHFGRKRILLWTIFGAVLAFVFSGIAIMARSIVLLFVARFLAGAFAGNGSTAQASISDMSTERNKAKNLSLVGIIGGIAWIVGPPLGGILATPKWVSWFNYATPFWFLALLFFFNWLWVGKSYEESFEKKERHDWKQEIRDLAKLSKIPRMKGWLVVATFFYFSWFLFILYYPTMFVQQFQFDQEKIGLFSGYLALFWVTGSFIVNRWLGEKMTPEKKVLLVLPFAGGSLLIACLFESIPGWIAMTPLFTLAVTIGWTELMALMSNLAGRENQGKVFGILQSLMALASLMAPICSGFVAAYDLQFPFYLGIIVFFALTFFALGLQAAARRARN